MSIVTVFGGNAVETDNAGYQEAYELGQLLAQAGYTVATGGYYGTMEATSRGAKEAEVRTHTRVIGVTTARFDDRLGPNQWVDEEIKFPTLFQRLQYLVTFSDALVALRGGVGTLSEVALSWSLMQVAEMPRKPLVLVGPHWRQIMETFHRESTVKERDWALLSFADNVSQVLPLLEQVAGSRMQEADHATRNMQHG
jgi:uncharacterized protein (TIGR00730 family)